MPRFDVRCDAVANAWGEDDRLCAKGEGLVGREFGFVQRGEGTMSITAPKATASNR
jgi:hypothetical protein